MTYPRAVTCEYFNILSFYKKNTNWRLKCHNEISLNTAALGRICQLYLTLQEINITNNMKLSVPVHYMWAICFMLLALEGERAHGIFPLFGLPGPIVEAISSTFTLGARKLKIRYKVLSFLIIPFFQKQSLKLELFKP